MSRVESVAQSAAGKLTADTGIQLRDFGSSLYKNERFMESQGKMCYSGCRLRYVLRKAENKPGGSCLTENIMVDILFPDGINGTNGNVENSFKKSFQPVTSAADISRNYRATFASNE